MDVADSKPSGHAMIFSRTTIEYVPELNKFYTSNAGDNTIGVVDLRKDEGRQKLPTGKNPDGSTYAVPFRKLYVSDERGKAETIVESPKTKL